MSVWAESRRDLLATLSKGEAPSSDQGRASLYISDGLEKQQPKKSVKANRPDSSVAALPFLQLTPTGVNSTSPIWCAATVM